MTDTLSDGTVPAVMDSARSLGKRILEHFVAPAEPRVDEVPAPDTRPSAVSGVEPRATDDVPTPSALPAEAWPTPWTAAGVDQPVKSRGGGGVDESTTPRPATGAPEPTTRRPTTAAPEPTTDRPTTGASAPTTRRPTTAAPEPTTHRPTTGAPESTTRRPTTAVPEPANPRTADGWLPPTPPADALCFTPLPAGDTALGPPASGVVGRVLSVVAAPTPSADPSPTARAGTVAGLARFLRSEPKRPADTSGDVLHAARPRRAPRVRRSAVAPRPERVVVLGVPDDITPAAAAVANEVRGPRGVVLAVWCPQSSMDFGDAPATFGARRLAGALTAEGHSATPLGRLARTELPSDPGPAAAAYERLVGARPAPVVLAVAGPRPDEFEPLLRRADLVVVTIRPADTLLADLARGSLAGLTARVITVAPPVGPGRLLASAGFGQLPSIRDAVRGRVAS